MSEQTRACEGFNNKSGDKHQLANLLVSAACLSMLHLYRSACKAIPWPLSDPQPPFFLFFIIFFPSRILQIFRGSSPLICSTDSKRGGSRRTAPSVWGQSILGKELQRPPALLFHTGTDRSVFIPAPPKTLVSLNGVDCCHFT